MRIFALGAVSALAFASPTFAGGFHVEAHGGWDRVSVAGGNDDGVVYGVGAGYDHPIGSAMFIGVEGNVDDSTVKECASDVFVLGDRACAKAGRDLSAVVRAGWQVSERNKLYFLGGYTNGRIKVTYTDSTGTVSDATNGDGFRLGAGYQYGFASGLYGKVEYRYSNYESDFSRHQVLAGLGFEFL